ncbi:MAG: formylglycine-generating enzyme family protein [Nitrospinae bacterium]|nr:formylglycine-generating enzyme family protein [Nitrospinota bacterium]
MKEPPKIQEEKRIEPPPPPSAPPLRTKVILPVVQNPQDKSEMVLIPTGPLFPPSPSSQKEKQGKDVIKVEVYQYYIDKLEISYEQFNVFLSEKNLKKTERAASCPDCAAGHVSFELASGYCQWAGKRLPSELEWLKAAQGDKASPWPWGDHYEPGRANIFGEEDGYPAGSPVGSFPLGASGYGVKDMIGNAWEWVSSPYLPGKENEIPKGDGVLKGGSWRSLPEQADLSYRHVVNKNLGLENFGFRCAKSF